MNKRERSCETRRVWKSRELSVVPCVRYEKKTWCIFSVRKKSWCYEIVHAETSAINTSMKWAFGSWNDTSCFAWMLSNDTSLIIYVCARCVFRFLCTFAKKKNAFVSKFLITRKQSCDTCEMSGINIFLAAGDIPLNSDVGEAKN